MWGLVAGLFAFVFAVVLLGVTQYRQGRVDRAVVLMALLMLIIGCFLVLGGIVSL